MSDTGKTIARPAWLGTDVSVSLRKLVFIRWVAIGGQAAAVVFAGLIMDFAPADLAGDGGDRDLGRAQRRHQRCRATAARGSATARPRSISATT